MPSMGDRRRAPSLVGLGHGRTSQAAALPRATSPLAGFERLRELGRGVSGSVWLVRRKCDERLLALKTLQLPPLARKEDKALAERRQALREVDLLRSVTSHHVIRYVDAIFVPASVGCSQTMLHVLTEFCEGGDLLTNLRNNGAGRGLPEVDVCRYSRAVASGLHELHQKRVLHRDVKLANVFLRRCSDSPTGARHIVQLAGARSRTPSRELPKRIQRARSCGNRGLNTVGNNRFEAVVGDLGLARALTGSQSLACTMVGTPHYCAPEIFEGKPYDEKADIYSFGICLYELMHGHVPHADVQNVGALVRRVLHINTLDNLDGGEQESHIHMDDRYSSGLRDVATACLKVLPESRPTAAELLLRIPLGVSPSASALSSQCTRSVSVDALRALGRGSEHAVIETPRRRPEPKPATPSTAFRFTPPVRGTPVDEASGTSPSLSSSRQGGTAAKAVPFLEAVKAVAVLDDAFQAVAALNFNGAYERSKQEPTAGVQVVSQCLASQCAEQPLDHGGLLQANDKQTEFVMAAAVAQRTTRPQSAEEAVLWHALLNPAGLPQESHNAVSSDAASAARSVPAPKAVEVAGILCPQVHGSALDKLLQNPPDAEHEGTVPSQVLVASETLPGSALATVVDVAEFMDGACQEGESPVFDTRWSTIAGNPQSQLTLRANVVQEPILEQALLASQLPPQVCMPAPLVDGVEFTSVFCADVCIPSDRPQREASEVAPVVQVTLRPRPDEHAILSQALLVPAETKQLQLAQATMGTVIDRMGACGCGGDDAEIMVLCAPRGTLDNPSSDVAGPPPSTVLEAPGLACVSGAPCGRTGVDCGQVLPARSIIESRAQLTATRVQDMGHCDRFLRENRCEGLHQIGRKDLAAYVADSQNCWEQWRRDRAQAKTDQVATGVPVALLRAPPARAPAARAGSFGAAPSRGSHGKVAPALALGLGRGGTAAKPPRSRRYDRRGALAECTPRQCSRPEVAPLDRHRRETTAADVRALPDDPCAAA